MAKDTPRPATNRSPRLLDDYSKSFERGWALGPTTHTQMSSREDFTIRAVQVPSQRVLPSFPGGLTMDHAASLRNTIVAWIGLDWADQKHDICLQANGSAAIKHLVVEHQPEALHSWVADLRRQFPQGPIAVALEQSRGSLFYALMHYEFLRLYPLSLPRRWRTTAKRFTPAAARMIRLMRSSCWSSCASIPSAFDPGWPTMYRRASSRC